jgi:FKBP-type peptidyl-prolyl cis-trans isomerase SlyD
MKVQILSFHCVLKNRLGHFISSSFNQDVINQLEEGTGKLQALVAGLQDSKVGEKRQVKVSAVEAYGLYDPELVEEVRRSDLTDGDKLVVGSEVIRHSRDPGENEIYRVTHATQSSLTLDGNHPLAGQDLVFDIEIVTAREAMNEDFEMHAPLAKNNILH